MGTAHVEFVDAGPEPDPRRPRHADGDDADPGPSRPWAPAVLVVVAVAAVLVGARVLGAPPELPTPPSPPPPVVGGLVALPALFDPPAALVTVVDGTDRVWVLGAGGAVARVEDGRVRTVGAAGGWTRLVARPDGRSLVVGDDRGVAVLDPVTLAVRHRTVASAPVTALTAGVGSVWVATREGVQGWTADLSRPLRPLRVPADVATVRGLAVVGSLLQAVVTTTSGTTALLRLQPPGGAPRASTPFAGVVSVVTGGVALLAHRDASGAVRVARDGGSAPVDSVGRLPAGAAIWSPGGLRGVAWIASSPWTSVVTCYDGDGALVGRTGIGDSSSPVLGPVAVSGRAVYGVTGDGRLGRGPLGSCGRGA